MKNWLEKYIPWPYFFFEGLLDRTSRLQRTLIVAAFAIFFIAIYFGKVLIAPNEYTFARQGDDVKNYFTLESYVTQPINTGYRHYNSMNYPFRDIIFYCDNSPLIAVPVKWLSKHTHIPVKAIPIFNYIIILNFLFVSILCYLLISRFIKSHTLAIILSFSLPYFEPQSLRIVEGTENLGLSFIIIANLLLLYIIYERTEDGKSTWVYHILNFLLIVLTSFIHLYYLVILCLNTGLILFAYFILRVKRRQPYLKTLAGAVIVPVLAFCVTFLIYLVTDEFYNARSEKPMGYNYDAWKTMISGFYTSYAYMRIRFVFEATQYINYEAHTYLGAFLLYGSLIFAILYISKKASLQAFKNYFHKSSATFILLVSIASIVCLFIALGPEYYLMNGEYKFNNFLDLFSFIELFTNRIEHFRCLGRFSWLFFWAANFCFAFTLDNWLLSRKTLAIIVMYILSFLAIKDMSATGNEYCRNEFPNQFLQKNMPPEVQRLNADMQKRHYDAIMPLPFFLVGSEEHNRTMDAPTYAYAQFYFQLSSLTKLPLMSSQLARTPIPSNTSLFDFYWHLKQDTVLQSSLWGKKIAIIEDDAAYNTRSGFPVLDNDMLREAFYNSQKLPHFYRVTPIDTVGNYIMYLWEP